MPVSVSIVAPVYRDGANLNELYARTRAALEPRYSDFELILIDDGSPDTSWSVISALAAADTRVKGIRLSRNFGQHPAIAAGFDRAQGSAIILMDADLEDRPEDLPGLIDRLGPGVDIVYTVKQGERGGPLQRLTSMLFHQTFAQITRTNVPMEIGTLRVFNRKVLAAIQAHKEYNVLFGPLMISLGFQSQFVPVHRETRTGRVSTYTFWRRLGLAAKSLASYTNIPHRIFLTTGFIATLISIAYGFAIVLDYVFFGHRLPPGLTLIALLIIVFMGLMLMALGIIGSYVFSVYQEVLARPRYLVAEQLNAGPTASLLPEPNHAEVHRVAHP
jgi:polyisoprenyl-phosphate glycosyltransferase